MATKKKPTFKEEWQVYFGDWADYDDGVLERGQLNDAIRCSSLEEAKAELEEGILDGNEEAGVIVHVKFTLIATGSSVPRDVSIKTV